MEHPIWEMRVRRSIPFLNHECALTVWRGPTFASDFSFRCFLLLGDYSSRSGVNWPLNKPLMRFYQLVFPSAGFVVGVSGAKYETASLFLVFC